MSAGLLLCCEASPRLYLGLRLPKGVSLLPPQGVGNGPTLTLASNMAFLKNPSRFRPRFDGPNHRLAGALAALPLLLGVSVTLPAQAQKIYFEGFETIPLGPNREEALAGDAVWSKAGPAGWVADDSGVPGLGTSTDGIVEWAGWSFANKDWWVRTAGDQRRSEFAFGLGTVMIADPDEWDDAAHTKGLLNTYITTPAIDVTGIAANSLVIAFDSSWRPEARDDGEPNFPVAEDGSRINNQTGLVHTLFDAAAPAEVIKWDSVSDSPTYKADGLFINEAVIMPLNNPAGAKSLKLRFGMIEAANDWWWAVDNVAVGIPPLVTGASGTGIGFSVRISEALGKSVKDSPAVTAKLDGQTVAVTTSRQGDNNDRVVVAHDQSPRIFAPLSTHKVEVTFATSDGRTVTDSVDFIAPGYTTVASTPSTVTATIAETTYLSVDEAKGIRLELDGAAITATSVTRTDLTAADGSDSPDTLAVLHRVPAPFASGSAHTLKVTFTTKTAQEVSQTVAFTAPVYATIPASLATAIGTGADAGMRWRTHQLPSRADNLAEADKQLAGELGASEHDPSGQNAQGFYDIAWVNFEQVGGNAGNFRGDSSVAGQDVADEMIPGIPGLNGRNDDIAGEAVTFIEFPTAGIYTMGAVHDDGLRISVGNATNPNFLALGGAPGNTTSTFYFRIEQPGVYAFRLLWYEGGGGAHVEWYTVNADGTRALVNGTQTGALKAFKRRTTAEPALPAATPTIGIARSGADVTVTYTGTLLGADAVNGPYAPVAGATGGSFKVTPTVTQKFYRAQQ